MKKYRIKLIALFVAVALMLPSFTGAGALVESEVDDGLLTLEEIEEIGRLEAPATKAFEEINEAWTNAAGVICYPDSFGGAYITENYLLCVKVVQGNTTFVDEIVKIVTDPSVLVFEDTDISRNDLFALRDNLPEYVQQFDVIGTGISLYDSSVNVYISEESFAHAKQHSLKSHELQHITLIPYKKGDRPTKNTQLYLGNLLASSDGTGATGSYGSLGLYGKCQFEGSVSQECILTAGHVAQIFRDNNVGMACGSKIVIPALWFRNASYCKTMYTGGTDTYGYYYGDWAVICYRDLEKTNYVQITKTSYQHITHEMSAGIDELFGKSVFKSCGVSGYRKAKVANCGSQVTFPDGDKVGSLVTVDSGSFSTVGDSGATVYTTNGSGALAFCGIVTASDTSLCHFTPLSIIVEKTGFVPYLG